MPRPLFETSTPALLDLFSNGKQYDVPNFQQEYSWEEEHDLDFETSSATIEHILPENPGGAWAGFAESHSGRTQDLERFIYRIGNLAILTPPENRDVGSISFAEKQSIYRQSGFHLTRSLADYADWTPSAIDQRQEKMARHAQTIWRVDALSEALS